MLERRSHAPGAVPWQPVPDPSLAASVWSDSVLKALFDAIHAVALTMAGTTSLMHEAKVDAVTVPQALALSTPLSCVDRSAGHGAW